MYDSFLPCECPTSRTIPTFFREISVELPRPNIFSRGASTYPFDARFYFDWSKIHGRSLNLSRLLAMVIVHSNTQFTVTEYAAKVHQRSPRPVELRIC
jgi:hypothetical protein